MCKFLLRAMALITFAFTGVAQAQSYVGVDLGLNAVNYSDKHVADRYNYNGMAFHTYFGRMINDKIS